MNLTESVHHDVVTEEGQDSARVVGGLSDVFNVTLSQDAISASQGFMLIDLSDTVNWPHTETGHINIKWLQINLNPGGSFRGTVDLGFLTNVDATDGDLNIVNQYGFAKESTRVDIYKYFEASHFCLKPAHWFGPKVANDATWQTDVDLHGPDGAVAYPSGDMDMVIKVNRTAGDLDLNITIGYETVAGA